MCLQDFGRSMEDICSNFDCPPEALQIAQEFPEPAACITQLRGSGMSDEAVQALARVLPPEKGVEWAEWSAQLAGEKVELSAEELEALEAAKTWAIDPSEANRLDAEFAATQVPSNTPAMWAANAASWSKQIELPEPATPLPYAGDLTARAVVGAVRLSAAIAGTGKPIEPWNFSGNAVGDDWMAESGDMATGALREQAMSLTADQKAEAAKLLDPFLNKGIDLAGSVDGFTCTDPLCKAKPILEQGIAPKTPHI